jgi:hypothetical protein
MENGSVSMKLSIFPCLSDLRLGNRVWVKLEVRRLSCLVPLPQEVRLSCLVNICCLYCDKDKRQARRDKQWFLFTFG